MPKSKKPAILICGLAGTGKSVLCEKVAKYFGLKYHPTSGILRAIMEKDLKKQRIAAAKNTGFWESEEGKQFIQKRAQNQKFDKLLDGELFAIIKKGGVVLDSWVMPWISKEGYKIWLTATNEVRFARIAKRDGKSLEETKKSAVERETKSAEIYKKLYGFNWGKDLEVFDLIIDTDKLTEEEVFEKAKAAIEKNLSLHKQGN